jgi:hypothetical protein
VDTEVRLPGGHTFVVRIWRETGAEHPQWRGRIEHVQSGKQRAFLRLAEMLEFIESFATLGRGEGE